MLHPKGPTMPAVLSLLFLFLLSPTWGESLEDQYLSRMDAGRASLTDQKPNLAIKAFEAAEQLAVAGWTANDKRVAEARYLLGEALADCGPAQHPKARQKLRQALEWYDKYEGLESPVGTAIRFRLVALYFGETPPNYSGAEHEAEIGYAAAKKLWESDDPALRESRFMLGFLYFQKTRYQDAIALFEIILPELVQLGDTEQTKATGFLYYTSLRRIGEHERAAAILQQHPEIAEHIRRSEKERAEAQRASAQTRASQPEDSYGLGGFVGSSPGGGPVHVRGYYRKDGTYVRPHTRSLPRR